MALAVARGALSLQYCSQWLRYPCSKAGPRRARLGGAIAAAAIHDVALAELADRFAIIARDGALI
jgi:hypothetical protein